MPKYIAYTHVDHQGFADKAKAAGLKHKFSKEHDIPDAKDYADLDADGDTIVAHQLEHKSAAKVNKFTNDHLPTHLADGSGDEGRNGTGIGSDYVHRLKEDIEDDTTAVEPIDETAALDSLAPGSMAAGKANKSFAMGKIVNAVAGMDQETINKFVAMIDQIGHEADSISSGDAAKNKASIDTKPSAASESANIDDGLRAIIKEDIANLFEGDEVKQELKDKIGVVIESAINMKTAKRIVELEEEYEERLNEEVESISEDLLGTLEAALDSIVENWMERNEVAIVSTLRSDLTEQFLEDLHGLFSTHYIDVPDAKVDVVEEMNARIEELEEIASEALEENMALKTAIAEATEEVEIADVVAEATKGLTLSDAEKLQDLTETVDFTSIEDFKSKVGILKETYFATAPTTKKTPAVLFEEVSEIDDTEKKSNLTGQMKNYVETIANTIR